MAKKEDWDFFLPKETTLSIVKADNQLEDDPKGKEKLPSEKKKTLEQRLIDNSKGEKLEELNIKKLNKRIKKSGYSLKDLKQLKQKRRTSKNRGYARKSREKRKAKFIKLELEKSALDLLELQLKKDNASLDNSLDVLKEVIQGLEIEEDLLLKQRGVEEVANKLEELRNFKPVPPKKRKCQPPRQARDNLDESQKQTLRKCEKTEHEVYGMTKKEFNTFLEDLSEEDKDIMRKIRRMEQNRKSAHKCRGKNIAMENENESKKLRLKCLMESKEGAKAGRDPN